MSGVQYSLGEFLAAIGKGIISLDEKTRLRLIIDNNNTLAGKNEKDRTVVGRTGITRTKHDSQLRRNVSRGP
jgi:hypothetical protein